MLYSVPKVGQYVRKVDKDVVIRVSYKDYGEMLFRKEPEAYDSSVSCHSRNLS